MSTVAEIPKWHGFLTPVLRALADGRSRARADLIEAALDIAEVNEEQRNVRVRSGGSQAKGRVGWAISHLIAAQALERPEGALYKITVEGLALLERHPERMAQAELREVPAYRAHQKAIKAARRDGATVVAPEAADDTEEDSQDMIDAAIDRIEAEVGATLLARLRESHPDFFEEAVVKLLLGMGYGGAEQRGRRIGGSGDGGVDGVIDQDALGLEQIYVQAKRYAEGNSIGRRDYRSVHRCTPRIRSQQGCLHHHQHLYPACSRVRGKHPDQDRADRWQTAGVLDDQVSRRSSGQTEL